jgi:hypothetical protein
MHFLSQQGMEMNMVEDMVMRSVYLRPAQDAELRDLAHRLNVTKSDLIRSAISVKLFEWLQTNDCDSILAEVELGRRDEAAIRSGRRGRGKAATGAAIDAAAPLAQPQAAVEPKRSPAAKKTVRRARSPSDALV